MNLTVSIFRHGINNDDVGPIAKASFEETPEMFMRAAKHAELDIMRGVSSNVMCGQEGYFGTNSFNVVLDMKKMATMKAYDYDSTKDEEYIDDMFGDIENADDPCSKSNLAIKNNVGAIQESNLGDVDDDYNPGF